MIWKIAIAIILCLMLTGNKKVRVYKVFLEQMHVFRNARTRKLSIWDIICFLILPLILSLIFVIEYNILISDNLAGILTTVYAFIFTVLFGFAAILIGKLESNNGIEKKVVGETFISIITSTLLALVAAVMSIILLIVDYEIATVVISVIIFWISFVIMMLILMIIKRTYNIYSGVDD